MGRPISAPKLVLLPIEGLRFTEHAGVAVVEGHPGCLPTAALAGYFAAPGAEVRARQLKKRMERWMGCPWVPVRDKYHGWDKSQHGEAHQRCYVFKYTATGSRLYGFIAHPDVSVPRFQLFVPTETADKHEDATERSILDRCAEVAEDPGVLALFRSLPADWRSRF